MRVLLVEDDESFLGEVAPRIEEIISSGNLTMARGRQSALAALEAQCYDVIILDLKIPVGDGGLDKDVQHGRSVFQQAQVTAPATPVYFLTGSSTEPFVNELLKHADKVDVWGNRRPVSTVQVFKKAELSDFLDELKDVTACVHATDDIEIVPRGRSLNLTQEQRRIIKVFTRRCDGRLCEVSSLTGGLSSSQVVKVIVKDASGGVSFIAAGKLHDIAGIEAEVGRYERHVPVLQPGAYPTLIHVVKAGVGTSAGAFYRLLDGYDDNLFSLLATDPAKAANIVTSLRTLLNPWGNWANTSNRAVTEVRGRLLADGKALELSQQFHLAWTNAMETKAIQVAWGCIHGDLHGSNILIDSASRPILIDFGDVGPGPRSMDPVTLELSLFFHPAARDLRKGWPSPAVAAQWHDDTNYLDGCPFPDFVVACREWARGTAAGQREIYASAYSYLMRQLKYPETDKDLAVALLGSVKMAFDGTY